jgi:hypothetical protein
MEAGCRTYTSSVVTRSCDLEHRRVRKGVIALKQEVRICMSSGKIRVLVFAVFLMLLLVFAVAYEPTNAASQPANQGKTAGVPARQPVRR